jgi:hypothetical protein
MQSGADRATIPEPVHAFALLVEAFASGVRASCERHRKHLLACGWIVARRSKKTSQRIPGLDALARASLPLEFIDDFSSMNSSSFYSTTSSMPTPAGPVKNSNRQDVQTVSDGNSRNPAVPVFAAMVEAIGQERWVDAEIHRKELFALGWVVGRRPGSGTRSLTESVGPGPGLSVRQRKVLTTVVVVIGLTGFWQVGAENDNLHKAKTPGAQSRSSRESGQASVSRTAGLDATPWYGGEAPHRVPS